MFSSKFRFVYRSVHCIRPEENFIRSVAEPRGASSELSVLGDVYIPHWVQATQPLFQWQFIADTTWVLQWLVTCWVNALLPTLYFSMSCHLKSNAHFRKTFSTCLTVNLSFSKFEPLQAMSLLDSEAAFKKRVIEIGDDGLFQTLDNSGLRTFSSLAFDNSLQNIQ